VFSGLLLADNASTTEEDESFVQIHLESVKMVIFPRLWQSIIPDSIIAQFAEVLRKASRLYRYDVAVSNGGTTAPAITESSEGMRYWAFDVLIAASSVDESLETDDLLEGKKRVASISSKSLMLRIEEGLNRFLADSRIRGQIPFGRSGS